MRITATPRVHYGLFKLRHESATKRTPPAGYFTRSYGKVFFLIHGSKTWCSCNMCHHLVVMSWLFAMRDVLLGCLNSMVDHCIISMFLDHTCFVTQKSSSRFFTNFIVLNSTPKKAQVQGRAISSHFASSGFRRPKPTCAARRTNKNLRGTKAPAAPCEASRRRQCSRTWVVV